MGQTELNLVKTNIWTTQGPPNIIEFSKITTYFIIGPNWINPFIFRLGWVDSELSNFNQNNWIQNPTLIWNFNPNLCVTSPQSKIKFLLESNTCHQDKSFIMYKFVFAIGLINLITESICRITYHLI
jgi:hypothetical protein